MMPIANRGDALIRQHTLLCRLATEMRALRIEHFLDIQKDFGVSERTIRRDLDCLSKVQHYNIVKGYVRGGVCSWKITQQIPVFESHVPAPKTKQCSACRRVKLVPDDFTKDSGSFDRYDKTCRVCKNKRRKRPLTLKQHAAANKSKRRFRKRHPDA